MQLLTLIKGVASTGHFPIPGGNLFSALKVTKQRCFNPIFLHVRRTLNLRHIKMSNYLDDMKYFKVNKIWTFLRLNIRMFHESFAHASKPLFYKFDAKKHFFFIL